MDREKRRGGDESRERAPGAACGGRRTVFATLLGKYEPLIRRSVREHLGPERYRREGSDLLQSVRLAVLERLPALKSRNEGSFVAWLKKVLRTRLLDREKRERARRRSPSRPLLRLSGQLEVAARGDTPSRVLAAREESDRVRRAIERVPGQYREVLRLVHERAPSPEEVAAFLGKGPDAARKFMERALTSLRKSLQEESVRPGRPEGKDRPEGR